MKGAILENKKDTNKRSEIRKRDFHLPFSNLRNEMNRLFDDFFHGKETNYSLWNEMETEVCAKVDVKDNDDEIIVIAELPGVKLEDIELTVGTDYLRIEGEKKEEREEKEKGQYRLERSFGAFMRQIPLPVDVEKDNASASFKNGVLRIVLPKNREMLREARKVEIRKG